MLLHGQPLTEISEKLTWFFNKSLWSKSKGNYVFRAENLIKLLGLQLKLCQLALGYPKHLCVNKILTYSKKHKKFTLK